MKKSFLSTSLKLIFIVLFNAVFFIAGGTDHPASVWIAYGFIHFAYIMVAVTPYLAGNSRNAAMFGFALGHISSVYFIVELFIGLLFIIIGGEGYKASLLIQLVLAGVYVAALIVSILSNDATTESVERQQAEVAYVKDAASRIKILMGKFAEKEVDKALENAYDALHSSPTHSSVSVLDIEKEILNKISSLEYAVSSNAPDKVIYTAKEITELTEERNRILRMSN